MCNKNVQMGLSLVTTEQSSVRYRLKVALFVDNNYIIAIIIHTSIGTRSNEQFTQCDQSNNSCVGTQIIFFSVYLTKFPVFIFRSLLFSVSNAFENILFAINV